MRKRLSTQFPVEMAMNIPWVMVRPARKAPQVYAPLAQRLGTHHLKSEPENAAFRVLYRRRYALATPLYAKDGAALRAVTSFVRRSSVWRGLSWRTRWRVRRVMVAWWCFRPVRIF